MQKRNPKAVIVFSILTLGIYPWIYLYCTSAELSEKTGTHLNPKFEAMIMVLSLGMYGLYIPFRDQKIVDRFLEDAKVKRVIKAWMIGALIFMPIPLAILLFTIPSFVHGMEAMTQAYYMMIGYCLVFVSWCFAFFFHQVELNHFADFSIGESLQPVFD